MLVLIIEDDPVQADLMQQTIERELGAKVRRIATESEFYTRLEEIVARRPDAIVIDVMLRWADPAESMPSKPVDYNATGGYRRAGLRCRKRLADHPGALGFATLLYTVLNREALMGISDGEYLQKGDGFDQLLNRLREITAMQPKPVQKGTQARDPRGS